jgi:hypothetical protein
MIASPSGTELLMVGTQCHCPKFGKLVLRPQGLEWLTSGEICGKRIIAEAHKSFKNAFDSIERAMERDGDDILVAAIAERQWASNNPTSLQEAPLINLVGTLGR